MSRHIIQIAVGNGARENFSDRLYAICNDGTVWTKFGPLGAGPWQQVDDVPQERQSDPLK
jgi:hypothetical protein